MKRFWWSIVASLAALIIVLSTMPPPATGFSAVEAGKSFELTAAGHVHIVVKPAYFDRFDVEVIDQANWELRRSGSTYASVSALTRINVSSVDMESDLPAGSYIMFVTAYLNNASDDADHSSENMAALSIAVNDSVTVTYPSTTTSWVQIVVIVVVLAAAVSLSYVMVKKRRSR